MRIVDVAWKDFTQLLKQLGYKKAPGVARDSELYIHMLGRAVDGFP